MPSDPKKAFNRFTTSRTKLRPPKSPEVEVMAPKEPAKERRAPLRLPEGVQLKEAGGLDPRAPVLPSRAIEKPEGIRLPGQGRVIKSAQPMAGAAVPRTRAEAAAQRAGMTVGGVTMSTGAGPRVQRLGAAELRGEERLPQKEAPSEKVPEKIETFGDFTSAQLSDSLTAPSGPPPGTTEPPEVEEEPAPPPEDSEYGTTSNALVFREYGEEAPTDVEDQARVATANDEYWEQQAVNAHRDFRNAQRAYARGEIGIAELEEARQESIEFFKSVPEEYRENTKKAVTRERRDNSWINTGGDNFENRHMDGSFTEIYDLDGDGNNRFVVEFENGRAAPVDPSKPNWIRDARGWFEDSGVDPEKWASSNYDMSFEDAMSFIATKGAELHSKRHGWGEDEMWDDPAWNVLVQEMTKNGLRVDETGVIVGRDGTAVGDIDRLWRNYQSFGLEALIYDPDAMSQAASGEAVDPAALVASDWASPVTSAAENAYSRLERDVEEGKVRPEDIGARSTRDQVSGREELPDRTESQIDLDTELASLEEEMGQVGSDLDARFSEMLTSTQQQAAAANARNLRVAMNRMARSGSSPEAIQGTTAQLDQAAELALQQQEAMARMQHEQQKAAFQMDVLDRRLNNIWQQAQLEATEEAQDKARAFQQYAVMQKSNLQREMMRMQQRQAQMANQFNFGEFAAKLGLQLGGAALGSLAGGAGAGIGSAIGQKIGSSIFSDVNYGGGGG